MDTSRVCGVESPYCVYTWSTTGWAVAAGGNKPVARDEGASNGDVPLWFDLHHQLCSIMAERAAVLIMWTALLDIFNIVMGLDYRWQDEEQLMVVWVLPYTPNFLLYNQRCARLLDLGELCQMHIDEAMWSQQQMTDFMHRLSVWLTNRGNGPESTDADHGGWLRQRWWTRGHPMSLQSMGSLGLAFIQDSIRVAAPLGVASYVVTSG